MAEPPSDCPSVVPFVGECITAGVAKHVRVSLQFESEPPAGCPLDHLGKASGRERSAALADEDEGRRRAFALQVLAGAELGVWWPRRRNCPDGTFIGRPAKSDGSQILSRGLACVWIGKNLKGDLLSLVEPLHPGAVHCAGVHEDVRAAIIRLDEAVTFFVIEPLHDSLRHINCLSGSAPTRRGYSHSGRILRVSSSQRGAQLAGVVRSVSEIVQAVTRRS
jgi:hypothetical protein